MIAKKNLLTQKWGLGVILDKGRTSTKILNKSGYLNASLFEYC